MNRRAELIRDHHAEQLATPLDVLRRLARVKAELERLEAEEQELRERLMVFLQDLPTPVLVDDAAGLEARLLAIRRRTIDAGKVPADLLAILARRDLVTVKAAAAPVVPPEAVTVTTRPQLRVRRRY
ncbi:hypothetical protein [Tepidiforma thermophila]|uniref:Uncharacterized protein n=1 Tax=Tepidiforma thermophila (strain KCTC 52669 / CGMCC 1.13589 / G233) TaxID=2761530 RepID=A0A2A9HEM0_TEPT2|nr:hypothetical protein [Tepidiforma thermophila]PFG73550.1 hypothetical protein A9A59_0750 [Tepidiforma thermophila]